MKEILIIITLFGGLFFFAVGTIGILRLPDFITRVHSAAKCDTLGAVLCLTALMIYSGYSASTLKILLIIIFLWITAPTATHLIAKVSYKKKDKKTLME
ncbi:monovalent cation/H(+) antiporter subunit G [Sporosalibacterium faouarense]|uniref:monovalent cation/H(+) antiporter subunit G n=1 Tax=Sporosalibacterium faouarense TaxID=516123 RepID=UPI00141D19D1|nr:monovalent cation/H(+) antiporter subunit G [Sporosalibacterium faouarense]MTI46922.1 monovalent cation/H(+) antiporter subunit G [Bacillota bacterium]